MQIERMDDGDLLGRLGQSTGHRTEGLHLSQIYGDLMRQMQPKRFTGTGFDTRKVETGLIFENMLERGLAEKFATERVGELVSDEGIWMSPDGVNPTLMAGEEYKCTWMSSRVQPGCETPYTDVSGEPNDKYVHWFIQMKGYAKWMGTDRFLLRVLHVNGDYTYPLGPQFVTSLIQFTAAEIESNWTMLVRHARRRKLLCETEIRNEIQGIHGSPIKRASSAS